MFSTTGEFLKNQKYPLITFVFIQNNSPIANTIEIIKKQIKIPTKISNFKNF